jgi:hypothetical protein
MIMGTIFLHNGQKMKVEVETLKENRKCKIGRLSIHHWTSDKGVASMKWTEIHSFTTYQDFNLFDFKEILLDGLPDEPALGS